MIDYDDIEEPIEDGEPLVWLEYTVRILTTAKAPTDGKARTLGDWFIYEYENARDVDATMRAPLGKLVRCSGKSPSCTQAAIDCYPAGRDIYKRPDDTDNVYCPHCDGAEDMPDE